MDDTGLTEENVTRRRGFVGTKVFEEALLDLTNAVDANALSPPQLAVHRALFAWRDRVARDEDESPSYVLPNHQLLRLAQGMPTNPEQLHAVGVLLSRGY